MKNVLLFVSLLCTFSLFATRHEGTLTLENWTIPRGFMTGPQLKTISLKYALEDVSPDAALTEWNSIAWQFGQQYIQNNQKYEIKDIGEEINSLTITKLVFKAAVVDVRNQTLGYISFDVSNIIPKAGGAFGQERKEPREWADLFIGMSADSAKKIYQSKWILKDLQITDIVFLGQDLIAQRIIAMQAQLNLSKVIADADAAFAAKDYLKAEGLYSQALKMQPNDANIAKKVNACRFENTAKQANDLFAQKKYEDALAFYKECQEYAKGDFNNSAKANEWIEKAETAMAKDRYNALLAQGDAAAARKDYTAAKKFYGDARQILPNDAQAQNTINAKLQQLEGEIAQANYAQAMQAGDMAFGRKEYQRAINEYKSALDFLPNDMTARNKLADCERMIRFDAEYEALRNDLVAKYRSEKAKAAQMRADALVLAARSFEANCESCNMEHVKFYVCMEDFFTQKEALAMHEAAFVVYKDPVAGKKAEIGNLCIKPNCNQFDNEANMNKASADDLIAAAVRKRKTASLDANLKEFDVTSQKLAEMALQKNPNHPFALAFASVFEKDLIQKTAMTEKAYSFSPNDVEIKKMRTDNNAIFTKEYFAKIANGDAAFVQRAIAQKLGVGAVYEGKDVMQQAIDNDRGEVLGLLLASYSSPSAYNLQDLLFRAAEKNTENAAKILIQKGAKVDVKNAKGETALIVATRLGNAKMIELLSENTSDTKSAILAAVEANQLESVRALLKKKDKVSIDARNDKGESLLMIAISKKYDDMAALLLDNGANQHFVSSQGETALSYAAYNRSPKMVAKLLAINASPSEVLAKVMGKNAADGQFLMTQIMQFAIDNGKTDWVKSCADYSKRLGEISLDNGKSALIYALEKKQTGICRLLFSDETELNKQMNGKYFLLEVVEKGEKDIFSDLLNTHKMDTEVKNDAQETAILIAARKGSKDMVQALINHKADWEAVDNNGNTALLLAANGKYLDVVRALRETNCNLFARNKKNLQALHYAVINKDISMVDYLLKNGAEVNAAGEFGMTALHYAAQSGSFEIARLLVEKEAAKDLKDNYGRTPAKVATKYKQKALAKFLKP